MSWSWRTVFPLFFSCFGLLLSPGFLVSMTGARYGIAFLWFRYILWWKLHFMVHWLPCSSQCSKHPFLSSGIQERDAPNHVSIDTSMHKITRWGMREFFRSLKALCSKNTRCWKITEKVSFNIASEANCIYILSGQKLIKNAKNGPFWRVFENLKLAVKQCYQTGQL